MNFETLRATEIFRSSHRTLNVRLDLTSSERLARAHSIACALAPSRWGNTPTGGTVERSHAKALTVQNVFRVPLAAGTRGWLFITSDQAAFSFWKSPQVLPSALVISDQNREPYAVLELLSSVPTGRSMVRYASVSLNPEPTMIFSLPVRTLLHFWKECGVRGPVTIPPLSRQRLLW
jgi:hypothetical protein